MKKLEFILPKKRVEDLIRLLASVGASGYSVLDLSDGYGPDAGRTNDLDWAHGTTCMVFTVCDEATASRAVKAVKSLIDVPGSSGFVSDAQPMYP